MGVIVMKTAKVLAIIGVVATATGLVMILAGQPGGPGMSMGGLSMALAGAGFANTAKRDHAA